MDRHRVWENGIFNLFLLMKKTSVEAHNSDISFLGPQCCSDFSSASQATPLIVMTLKISQLYLHLWITMERQHTLGLALPVQWHGKQRLYWHICRQKILTACFLLTFWQSSTNFKNFSFVLLSIS